MIIRNDTKNMERKIKIDKKCMFCGQDFVAQKTTTRYCSLPCASKAYKRRKREEKISLAKQEYNEPKLEKEALLSKAFLSPTECATLLGVGKATIYRYLKNSEIKCVQFSGKTKIRRSDIDEMFEKPTPYKARPILTNKPITEFYTIQEVKEKYNMTEGWISKIIKENAIPKVLKMGKCYLSKYHTDKALSYRLKHQHISEWYRVTDIKEKFNMTGSAIYSFVYENNIPRKKDGRITLYSKIDFDKAKGIITESEEYYTTSEAMEKYNLTRDMLYHYVKAYNIPKEKVGRQIKIQKTELDKLFDKVVL